MIYLFLRNLWVLRQWESETRKFGFIERVDESRITNVKNLESWRFELKPFVRASKGIVSYCFDSIDQNY